jgi:[glutamine synthetase] adenylyltransferase / [glutamine synthetase]-adenylyl-L-tyrosine phosphorylase
VIKALGQHSPLGRLYQVDMRLRPTGKSGSLVVPLEGFRKYYAEGSAQLWERQALTRGRVVYGDATFGESAVAVLHEAAYGPAWSPGMADEILAMRKRMEASSRGENDLKRGAGGIVDVEFLVQLLLLKYGRSYPQIVFANVWDVLAAVKKTKLLEPATCQSVVDHYQFLRTVESRQRMVYQQTLDTLPTTKEDMAKLVRRLGYHEKAPLQAVDHFLADLNERTARMRAIFLEVIERERQV